MFGWEKRGMDSAEAMLVTCAVWDIPKRELDLFVYKLDT
jgi:hypothetical protein